MVHTIGVIEAGRLRLWRRIGTKVTHWRTIRGSPERLARALRSALELDALAVSLGGWAQAFRLGLDAVEPRHLVKVTPRVLPEHDLDGGLG